MKISICSMKFKMLVTVLYGIAAVMSPATAVLSVGTTLLFFKSSTHSSFLSSAISCLQEFLTDSISTEFLLLNKGISTPSFSITKSSVFNGLRGMVVNFNEDNDKIFHYHYDDYVLLFHYVLGFLVLSIYALFLILLISFQTLSFYLL